MTLDELSRLENTSIRAFVDSCAPLLGGRVLDFGCGRQPYRAIIEVAGGDYHGFNDPKFPGCVGAPAAFIAVTDPLTLAWDTILCTQVLQYVPHPEKLLREFAGCCETLVLTYPTNWPEYSAGDLHRFTKEGMTRLLVSAGFTIVRHEERGRVMVGDNPFVIGYAAVATT